MTKLLEGDCNVEMKHIVNIEHFKVLRWKDKDSAVGEQEEGIFVMVLGGAVLGCLWRSRTFRD